MALGLCACMTLSSASVQTYGANIEEETYYADADQITQETEDSEEVQETEQTADPEEQEKLTEDVEENEPAEEQNIPEADNNTEEDQEIATQANTKKVIASGVCGENARWTYYNDRSIVISGSGPMYSFSWNDKEWVSTAPWMDYRAWIKKIVIEDGITSIGKFAFSDMGFGETGKYVPLEEIIIGNDVEVIEQQAFDLCNPSAEPIHLISFGSGIKKIEDRAFRLVGKAEKVTVPSLETWMQIEFAGDWSTPFGVGSELWKEKAPAFYVGGELLKDLVIPEGTTEIKDYTFWNCRLNSVKWPQQETVNRIGEGAFGYNAFEKIDIPTSVTVIDVAAFQSCINLKKMELSDQIQEIGGLAFYKDSSLETVILPTNLKKISSSMFRECSSLKNCEIPESVKSIEDWAFSECTVLPEIEIPKQVESIGTLAFNKCNAFKSLEIPDSVKTIGDSAFAREENLETISLSNGLKAIEDKTFLECGNLKTIQIPTSVEILGDRVFENCSSLQSISGGENITSVGTSVFGGCSQLQSVTIFPKISTINTSMFGGCKNLTHIVFPDKLTEIKSGAFSGCAFSDITVPDTVTSLEAYVFSGCKNLKRIQYSKELTAIGERCFSGCTTLDEIVIPERVRSLGEYVFSGCKSLSKITFEGDVPEISSYAFNQVKATCYYPKGNTTYTAEITTQDFGGDLIWTYEGEEADPDANKCGEHITWTLSESGELVLSGSGEMYDYSANDLEYAPWYEVRNSIKSIQISDGITHIGAYAFYKCVKATTVNALPDSITTIGAYAFSESYITEIGLPDSITTIGEYAFSNSRITEIELPDGLENITKGMLYNCKYLKQVKFPTKLKTIGDEAFQMCLGLNSVEIPEGVVSIGDSAFGQCGNSASWGMYYPSSSFTSVKLPSTLQELGSKVFFDCASLKTINIPGKVKALKDNIFMRCTNLRTITFDWGVPQFGSKVLYTTTKVTLTCYYPGNNPDWTADKLQKYGAYAVNWIAKEMPKPSETPGSGSDGNGENGDGNGSGSGDSSGSGSGNGNTTGGNNNTGGGNTGGNNTGGNTTGGDTTDGKEMTLGYTAHSLTLNGDIGVNFYLELNDAIIKDTSAVMQMEVNSQKVSEIRVADVVKNGTTEVTDEEGTTHACYKFTCNVYAKQMNDTIQATLKTSSGTWKETYSIKKYVEQAQNGSSENLKEVVNAMLDYGIWAQTLFGYKTDSLDGASLPDVSGVTKDQLSAYNETKSGAEENLEVYGTSLLLKEKTTIRMYYNLKNGSIEDYVFKIDGKKVAPAKSGNTGLYYVELSDIAAQDLDEAHTFTAGNLEISKYSVLTYVGKALESEKSSENNKNTAAALYLYWNAVEKYFAAQGN